MERTRWLIMTTAVVLQLAAASLVQSQEFRMETDILVGDEKDPAVQTLTIFSDGVVYDFLRSGNEEITILDNRHGKLTLLDSKRRLKTTLTTDSMLDFVAQMKTMLLERDRGSLANPQFEKLLDEETGWLNLKGDELSYRVKGTAPEQKEAVVAYQQFADWYARLNCMRPGNVPPFARIRVNELVAQQGWLPATVERTVVLRRGLTSSEQVVRSQHLVNWRLSHNDRKMIDRAGNALAEYREVRFTEYIDVAEVAEK